MPTNNCERSGDGPAGTVSAASFRRGEGLHIPGPAAPVFHCAVIAAFTLHLAKPRSRSRSIAISARRTTTGPVETHRGRRRRHRNTQGDRHKEAGVPGGVKRRERQQAVLAPSQPLPARTWQNPVPSGSVGAGRGRAALPPLFPRPPGGAHARSLLIAVRPRRVSVRKRYLRRGDCHQ